MAISGESDYIYGFHDPGNWRWILTDKGRTGWVLVTEEIGHDPGSHSAPDYREWSDAGFGVIIRLNNGYSPRGTIPHSRHYDDFAQRCANHVADSKGAHVWIIGNEMNHANEQPGVQFRASGFTAEELIAPEKYAECFTKARARIKMLPGHEDDQVVLGAVAPYTAVLRYPGNESANWIKYFTDILEQLGMNLDGIALHAYTHGADPGLIFDEKQPWPQYPGLHYHFRAYRDFMRVIPPSLRHLPIYVTETDQSDDGQGHVLPWADVNSGWVRNAYQEIDNWNRTPGNQQIRCLLLYRWSPFDDWAIEGKRGVIEDMQMAAESGYKWSAAPLAGGKPFITASDHLNARSGPGTHFDRIGLLRKGITLEVLGRNPDNTWLHIALPDSKQKGWVSAQREAASVTGDLDEVEVLGAPEAPALSHVLSEAEGAAEGAAPLAVAKPAAAEKAAPRPSAPGRLIVTTTDELNVRSGPGTQHRRVGGVMKGATLEVTGRSPDNAWLQVAYPDARSRGWISARYVSASGDLASVEVVRASAAPPERSAAKPALRSPRPEGAGSAGEGSKGAPAAERQVIGGYTVSGDFLRFYRANAQLTGAPISNVAVENGVQTQYFESLALQATPGGVRPAKIGREVLAARRAIADLQGRAAQPASGGLSPSTFGFELEDVSAKLPKSTDKTWPRRALSDIAFVVVHHTAAGGTLSPASLARTMVDKQDKPGISYHFYITSNGTVYQTQPLEALTDHAVGQSRTSVGVALAGNFVGAQPGDEQLSSAGELCAWLMARLNLPFSRVKGMSEIVPGHKSPGDEWIQGASWKERLLAVSEAVKESLRGKVQAAWIASVPQPEWEDRTKTLPTYNALPAAEKKQGDSLDYPVRTLDSIRTLVVHHSGAPASTSVDEIARYQVTAQLKDNAGQITKEQWPGIGYHFFIAADGGIVKCHEMTTVCYHVSGLNAAGVGVCFAGNTTTSAAPPNGAQIAAGGRLIAYLMDQLNLDFDAIKGHKELEGVDCPGQWTDGVAWKHMLIGAIGAQMTVSQ
ncbi:MAG TPA: N-acetylmuramoyl-L-alanine amidase [Anaerolineae bacterium]|nr:N-acetylmuramoyl-L-alanine amidase [Anaerolineae bacterium]